MLQSKSSCAGSGPRTVACIPGEGSYMSASDGLCVYRDCYVTCSFYLGMFGPSSAFDLAIHCVGFVLKEGAEKMKPAAQPASSPPLPQLQTEPPSESQPDSAPARVSEAPQSKWADMRRPSLVRLEETGAEAIAALNNITFDIHPDVGLQLATPWQTRDVTEDSGSEPFPFEITGPPEVVAFLKRNTEEGFPLCGEQYVSDRWR